MKNLFENWNFKRCLFSFFLLGIFSFVTLSELNATHYRYGSITWEPVQGQANTIKFTVVSSWKRSFNSQWQNATIGQVISLGGSARLNLGNGVPLVAINPTVTAINASEDWISTEWEYTYIYPSAGNYTAFIQSGNRISTLQNNANGRYRVETIVNVGPNTTNRPPSSSLPPIVNLQTGFNTADKQVPGFDPDGDGIIFRLATQAEAAGGSSPYVQPTGLSISPTGLLSFNTTNLTVGDLYTTSIVLEDDETGAIGESKTMIDVILRIVDQSDPPVFDYAVTPANGAVYKIAPGQTVAFTVKADDADSLGTIGGNLILQASNTPATATFSPSLPTAVANPVQTNFSWTPLPSELGTRTITFFAEDDLLVQTITTVTINVTYAPIFDDLNNGGPTPGNQSFYCLQIGDPLNYTVQASDLDLNDIVSIISISPLSPPSSAATGFPVQTTLPPSFAVSAAIPTTPANPTSTQVNWIVAANDWGIYEVIFTAEDGFGDETNLEHYYIVDNAPSFTSSPLLNAFVNQAYSYTITATDPDVPGTDDAIFIDSSRSTIPSWMTLVDNGDGTAVLSGTPTVAEAGLQHTVSIELHDKTTHYRHTHCTQDFQDFIITVNPCNISLSGTTVNEVCPGAEDGSINLTVSNATGGVSYIWSNGEATEDIAGLASGTYTVTVTDGVACVESASYIINPGVDSIPPTISCPGDITINVEPAQCGAKVTYNVTSSDNCGLGPIAGFQYLGVFGDNSYYISSGTFTWTQAKVDAEAKGGHIVTIANAAENAYIAAFLAGRQPWIGLVDLLEEGTYQWITGEPFVYDNWASGEPNNQGNEDYGHFRTNGQWNDLPNTGPGGPVPYVLEIEGVTTTLTAGIASGETFPLGTTPVSFEAEDAAGNTANCTFNVTVIDNIPPTITCPADIVVANDAGNCSAVVNYSVPVGTDNCTGVNTVGAAMNIGSGGTYPVGVHTETYTVTDTAGNMANCSFTITVNDFELPMMTCRNIDVYLDANGEAFIANDAVDNGSTDNCAIVSYSTDVTSFDCAGLGANGVLLTVTDNHGNSNFCSATVTVYDSIPPVINCSADILVDNDSGDCGAVVDFLVTGSDNCGFTITSVPASGSFFDIGTTTVNSTITDAGGNVVNCSFDVTVEKSEDEHLLFSYTILARKEVHIHESDVLSGGVGVWESGKKVKVHKASTVNAFVKAPQIDLDNDSYIGTQIIGQANVALPTFRTNTMPSNLDLKVEDNQTETINLGDPIAYDKIEVKKNATLIINVSEIYAKEIKTKEGASIIFNQTTEIMLEKKLDLDKDNTFNSFDQDVYVYTEDHVDVKENSSVTANIYALKQIKAKGKKNGETTFMTGLFISDEKVHADKHTEWNWIADDCGWIDGAVNNSFGVPNIIDFNVQKEEIATEISWVMDKDVKIDLYEIEISTDGISFSLLDKLNADQVNSPSRYKMVDLKPSLGENFYRLKVYQLNGSFFYSKIQRVNFETDFEEVIVYPNPTSDLIQIELGEFAGKSGMIDIYNQLGQRMVGRNYKSFSTIPTVFDVRSFESGFYTISIKVDGHPRFTKKLVVSKY